MKSVRQSLVALVLLSLTTQLASAAPEGGHYVAPAKHGINKDAMTMQECRDRLAAPANERPPSDDPAIDKDAMCKNMLSAERAAGRTTRKKPASAASGAASR